MGMFDDIRCKYPLPMPENPQGYTGSQEFQTKDLDCIMDYYEIREDGSLWVEKRETEFIKGDPKGKTFSERFGQIKTLKKWFEQVNITTTILMYHYAEYNDRDYDYDVEYSVEFVGGKLNNVKLVSFNAFDNKQRKILHEKHKKELAEWYNYTQTKKYKYFWKPVGKILRLTLRKINDTLDSLRSKVDKISLYIK